MKARAGLVLGLLLAGCESQQAEVNDAPASASEVEVEVDPVLLRELLGEAVRVDGDQIRADGMLIRLAFDPLIRKTGPVSVQLVQGQGYRLSGIADGSPLWLLGLRDGDVLTGVDKQPIIGREHELRSAYEARPSRVELAYMRQRGPCNRRADRLGLGVAIIGLGQLGEFGLESGHRLAVPPTADDAQLRSRGRIRQGSALQGARSLRGRAQGAGQLARAIRGARPPGEDRSLGTRR